MLRNFSAVLAAHGSKPVGRGHDSFGAMTMLGCCTLQAGGLSHELNRTPDAERDDVKVATAEASASAAALLARYGPGAVKATLRAFERGGGEGRQLVQHLRAAFFTAASTTSPDFVCRAHRDSSMMELIFYFGRRRDGSGASAPLGRAEGFFAVPCLGALFALGASPRGCCLMQQASLAHFSVSGERLCAPSNGTTAASRAELAAYGAAAAARGDETERVGACFIAKEAVLSMREAEAAARARHAAASWGYTGSHNGSGGEAKRQRCDERL